MKYDLKPGAATRELHDRVLEAAAGAEEGQARVEAVADRSECCVGVAVGRPRQEPHTRRSCEIASLRRVGRNPEGARGGREELESRIDLAVGQIRGITISEGDDHGAQSVRW